MYQKYAFAESEFLRRERGRAQVAAELCFDVLVRQPDFTPYNYRVYRFTEPGSPSVRKDMQDDNGQYDSGNQCCRGSEKGSQVRADHD